MKTRVALAMLAAGAFGAVACTTSTEEEGDDASAAQSQPLRNTGGGDVDECTAALAGCYASCSASRNASCYRYCDVVYAKCRGLPEPSIDFARRAERSGRRT